MSQETTSGYTRPGYFSIIMGVAFSFLIVIMFCRYLPNLIKWGGNIFLILPDLVGVVDLVRPSQVQTVSLANNQTSLYFPEAGNYVMFTENEVLLQFAQTGSRPWFRVKPLESEDAAKLIAVTRGLRPYDTPFARGRPLFRFSIREAGFYEFVHQGTTIRGEIDLIPDYGTGYEFRIFLAYLAQVLLVIVPFALFYYNRHKDEWAERREMQKEKRAVMDDFFTRILRKRSKK